jgi:drug/metabolite transporter (DMT)-like permease
MRQSNLNGIILMIFAMAFFAAADTLIKLSAGFLAPAHTALLLIGGGLVIFWSAALACRVPLIDRRAFKPILLVRYCAETIATLGMVTSLSLVPLSTLGAILQATPLIVAGGAVLFLGETVTWRRWVAIGVGFVGMLFIVKPGAESFDVNILWSILAMLSLAARDLTTRVVPKDFSTTALATYTMAATLPFVLIWAFLSQPQILPSQIDNWWYVIGMVVLGSIGYLMITLSVRLAEVSVVSPFRYSRLLFLLVLGIWIFDESPDVWVLVGATLIIASGIYTMWRDRKKSQMVTAK